MFSMGAAKVVPSDRSKSHVSYYVAMAVIIGLLVALCCYACYYFVSKIKELTATDSPSPTPSTPCPKKAPASYPVQPVVRDSATAMAALCRQLPAPYSLQGDQVFPAPRSPDPRPAHSSPAPPDAPGGDIPPGGADQTAPAGPQPAEKVSESMPVVPCITVNAVR